jgi:hypothetical protein
MNNDHHDMCWILLRVRYRVLLLLAMFFLVPGGEKSKWLHVTASTNLKNYNLLTFHLFGSKFKICWTQKNYFVFKILILPPTFLPLGLHCLGQWHHLPRVSYAPAPNQTLISLPSSSQLVTILTEVTRFTRTKKKFKISDYSWCSYPCREFHKNLFQNIRVKYMDCWTEESSQLWVHFIHFMHWTQKYHIICTC